MLLPYCSRRTHVQLPHIESESQSSRFRPAEVRKIFALSACYPISPSPSHLRGSRARERGNIRSTHSLVHSYANVLQEHLRQIIIIRHRHWSRHRLCCPTAFTWTGSTPAARVTYLRAESLQTRSQEQLITMISRVSAFWAPTLLWPPYPRTSVEALPISTPFFQICR
jgi:hypothetical protein